MGSSGSGKSTMMNILACLDSQYEGTYILDGIVGVDIEETIRNVGELAQSGMKGTDETILDIMTK